MMERGNNSLCFPSPPAALPPPPLSLSLSLCRYAAVYFIRNLLSYVYIFYYCYLNTSNTPAFSDRVTLLLNYVCVSRGTCGSTFQTPFPARIVTIVDTLNANRNRFYSLNYNPGRNYVRRIYFHASGNTCTVMPVPPFSLPRLRDITRCGKLLSILQAARSERVFDPAEKTQIKSAIRRLRGVCLSFPREI